MIAAWPGLELEEKVAGDVQCRCMYTVCVGEFHLPHPCDLMEWSPSQLSPFLVSSLLLLHYLN